MEMPLIAVVTPVYNGANTIEKSIQSLLSQTFTDWINIIINDGSTDKTKEVLDKYEQDKRFVIIHFDENQGRAIARQVALEKVLELDVKYMCMLDADDMYYRDKLEWQYDYMENNPEISLMSCSLGYIDTELNLKGVLESYKEEKQLYFDNYKNYHPVPHACSIIRVKDIENISFDTNLTLGQDQDFMIRMLINKKYAFIPRIGYLYNRNDSFSFKKYKKSLELSVYAKKKINASRRLIFKLKIINFIKLIMVGLLTLFNKQDLYLNKIGRKTNEKELKEHLIKL